MCFFSFLFFYLSPHKNVLERPPVYGIPLFDNNIFICCRESREMDRLLKNINCRDVSPICLVSRDPIRVGLTFVGRRTCCPPRNAATVRREVPRAARYRAVGQKNEFASRTPPPSRDRTRMERPVNPVNAARRQAAL